MSYKTIKCEDIQKNPFALFGDEWALLTAGNETSFNTMTISWGGLGVFWQKNVVTTYVRPTRYTYEFCEREDYFSVSFPGKEARKDMALLGKLSGRDCDKLSQTSQTVDFCDGVPFIANSNLVLICKKLYSTDIVLGENQPKEIEQLYPIKDYHRIYISEVVKAFVKE